MEMEESIDLDRREHVRASFLVLEIKGKNYDKIFLAKTADVSQGGFSLSSRQPLKVGDRFPIEFVLPDNKTTVSCAGEVVWKKRYDKSGLDSEGIGVRFVDLDPEQKRILGEWIAREEEKEKIQQ